MDCEDLDFPDATFDAVTSRIAPHHFLDITRAIREIARVLRPGGQLALEDSCVPADPELDRFLNDVEKLRDPTHVRSYSEREWREMLEAAGFTLRTSRMYRKTHAVAEWVERSGIGQVAQDRLYAAFGASSPAARAYFYIQYDGEGAVRFTDDKLILRADLPG